MDDFDNDGFVDLIYTGRAARLLPQSTGTTPSRKCSNLFPGNNDTMHSFASGDVNRDGQLDVYASYGNGYA